MVPWCYCGGAEAQCVIFLDVDGVLNGHGTDFEAEEHKAQPPGAPCALDRRCLRRLRELLRRTQSRIVVSSSWRTDSRSLQALMAACNHAGIRSRVFIDQTPELRRPSSLAAQRAEEILLWLSKHRVKYGVERWVALDDLPLARACPEVAGHAVRTSPSTGVQDEDVQLAERILGVLPVSLPRSLGSPASNSVPKCIVLDIDGTLIDSLGLFEVSEKLGEDAPEPAFQDEDGDCIFPRPHLEAFLDFCFVHFAAVAIWTASSRRWAETVVRAVLGPRRPWAFVWSQERCVTDYTCCHGLSCYMPTTRKPLSKVWRSGARRALGFTRESTIMLEDTPANCGRNHGNGFIVPTFDIVAAVNAARTAGRPANDIEDDSLLRFMTHMETAVLPAANVRGGILQGQGAWLTGEPSK
eukprot:gnl/TRDRNA2_/TRDRNA2_135448_c0_seq1.p1 gnl/TRDRNA2_/TRDRNA2_135448_c0~~gnl/TRDRNA2_/TRDRNA2_135448_c0_seq1.p1  ORF type:complete len:411 (+),score=52.94 gnl/TRDRNA2_/TRDRNA2_135448_c0_seq1:76-1308(+)